MCTKRIGTGAVLLLFLVSPTGVSAAERQSTVVSVADRDDEPTYVLPSFHGYLWVSDDQFSLEVQDLRRRFGVGARVEPGFATFLDITMDDWNVDPSDAAAVRDGLRDTLMLLGRAVSRARANGIPVCISFNTAIREDQDAVQIAAEDADRRNVQWYADGTTASGWVTYSRYARRQRAVQEAYVREVAKDLAYYMATFPGVVVAASGDAETELSSGRAVDMTLADYSPFAILEFRDWLTGRGEYAPGGPYAGEASRYADRYRADATPGEDTSGDGHTLNGDFGTAFDSWRLRYDDWTLADDPWADPHAIPRTEYATVGWASADAGPGRFDAPRVYAWSDAYWQLWHEFRELLVWHYNVDFAQWMTTAVDPFTGTTVPSSRWYSHQIPADYLFGWTPSDVHPRWVTSASPWWTADIAPWGNPGVTAFNIVWQGAFAPTLRNVAPLILQRSTRWAVLEYYPLWPSANDPAVFAGEVDALLASKPALIVPVFWDHATYPIKDAPVESMLRDYMTRLGAEVDADGDGMSDAWERTFGLDPARNDAGDDLDGDGIANRDEYRADRRPADLRTQYFAEGIASDFFDTSIALLNVDGSRTGHVQVSASGENGAQTVRPLLLGPRESITVDGAALLGAASGAFSTVVQADVPVVGTRTIAWSRNGRYGAHAEHGMEKPSRSWFFAEGATHSGFQLFYLLQNPSDRQASVAATFLRGGRTAPVLRTFAVAPRGRLTIWANLVPGLQNEDVAASFISANDVEFVAERAMYLDGQGHPFEAGHAGAGVTAPATTWMLAEGATGDVFDMFVLVSNPDPTRTARLDVDYLLPRRASITRQYVVPPQSRLTIWVDRADPLLANTPVSPRVRSTNGVPVVVERAMWWPGPDQRQWTEAHVAAGSVRAAPRWALAGLSVGGRDDADSYVLVASQGASDTRADVTVSCEGGPIVTRSVTIPAGTRVTLDMRALVPEATDRNFGVLVEARDPDAALVVEFARYWSSDGRRWAAGTAAMATAVP